MQLDAHSMKKPNTLAPQAAPNTYKQHSTVERSTDIPYKWAMDYIDVVSSWH